MKILLVADKIHPALYDYFEPERWQDIDLILSAGDLKGGYLSFLVTMIRNVPLYYVRGNHDQRYEQTPPLGCENIHGRIINYHGLNILGLEGSIWYNGKGVQYKESQFWWQVVKLWPSLFRLGKIDIILTHNPAYGLNDGKGYAHRGSKALLYLIDRFQPRFFIHGHQHLSYAMRNRIITHNKTKVVNAYEYHIIEI